MSILIKGLQMPKAGELLCIDILPDGKVYIHLDLKSKQIATAVPVPPHGDLIDRDAALAELRDGMVMTGYQARAMDCISEYWVPTIIEAEGKE